MADERGCSKLSEPFAFCAKLSDCRAMPIGETVEEYCRDRVLALSPADFENVSRPVQL